MRSRFDATFAVATALSAIAVAIALLGLLGTTFVAGASVRDARGWQRFELQLDDGRDIPVDRPHPGPGRSSPATGNAYLIARSGASRRLRDDEYSLAIHGGSSRGPSGAMYPDIWWFASKALDLQIALEPVVPGQELTFAPVGKPYFDGAVDLYDVRPRTLGLRLGSGSVQLLGASPAPSD